MRTSRLTCAAAAACVLAAASGPARAETAPVPAAASGVATSSLTLLDVAAGGHSASVATLALVAQTAAPAPAASVAVTPLTVDGTAHGAQTVTPSGGSTGVPAVDSADVAPGLAGLLRVTSPGLTASATTSEDVAARAGTSSLGAVGVLGLPLRLDGTLDASSVVARSGATGMQTLAVEDLALPSVADLLGALGLDAARLPTEVLVELLRELDLLTPAVSDADRVLTEASARIAAQVDAAQATLDAASADLAARTTQLTGARSDLAAKEKELADRTVALAPLRAAVTSAQSELAKADAAPVMATSALDAALAAAGLSSLAEYVALPSGLKDPLAPTIDPLVAAVAAARTVVTSATGVLARATADLAAAQSAVDVSTAAVTAATGVVASLQAAVDAAQRLVEEALGALRSVLAGVQPQVDRLVAEVLAVLDATPLVSLDRLRVVTRAGAVSAGPGGQTAEVVGGEIVGLRVVGTDVLADVLGTTRVDLAGLTGSTLARVAGRVTQLTGVLSSVLSTVPGFPTLAVPAPEVGLLTRSTSTGVVDGFGTAQTALTALSITLPSLRVPTALAVPGAASLPALTGVPQVAGLLTTAPLRLQVATLADRVRFRPAVAAAAPAPAAPPASRPTSPTGGTPPATSSADDVTPRDATPPTTVSSGTTLPRTGPGSATAVLGVVLLGAAAVLRRRREVAVP